MPRTFKATIALIVVLCLVALVTIVNVVQTNSTESSVRDLRQQVDALAETNAKILRKLESGVAVAGGGAGGSRQAGGGVDKYAASLDDPDNMLVAATHLKIPADAKYGGTLRATLGDTPKGYNWLTENSVDVSNIQQLVHNYFARRDFNDPDNFVPELAHKIVINDEKTEYTIHLRDDVYWHVPNVDFSKPENAWLKEPRKLTAEDAVFFFELVKNPQVEAGALKNYYEDMEGAEVIDENTFKVTWKKPVYQSLSATVETYPLPKWLFTRDRQGNELPEETLGLKFNSHWASPLALGTGPYRHVETKPGERVILDQNDRYWGPRYPLQRIEYSIIKDPDTTYLKLKGDEIDFISSVPAPKYKSDILEGKNTPFQTGEMEYDIVDRFAYYYLGWNADKPLFEDKVVRRAMTMAMNRAGVIQNVFHGLGTIQTGTYYWKHPANDPNVEPFPYDLQKAKQLLEEAGWVDSDSDGILDKVIDGEKVDFKFSILGYGSSPVWKSVLAVYKEDLRKIGVMMNPQFVDWPTMQKKMDEKAFDAYTGGWGLSWDNDPFQLWHSSQADIAKGSNRVGFRNKEADQIIETLRETFDAEKRQELLRRFHVILHEEQPYTFLFAPQSVPAWQPRLENVVINEIRPQYYSLPWYVDDSVTKAPAK